MSKNVNILEQIHKGGGKFTVVGLAEFLGVSPSTADNWMRKGIKLGYFVGKTEPKGTHEGTKGSVGRPRVVYHLTAKGIKRMEEIRKMQKEGEPA